MTAVDGAGTNRLAALKKKHSKTGEDTKYHGTILGRSNDIGELQIQVEGGPDTSIEEWISKRSGKAPEPEPEEEPQQQNGHLSDDDSGLSSVGDRLDNEMELEMT